MHIKSRRKKHGCQRGKFSALRDLVRHCNKLTEPGDINCATSSSIIPVTPEKVARQIKAAADPLSKQSWRPCDLMKELRKVSPMCSEENTGLIRGPSRAHSSMFVTGIMECKMNHIESSRFSTTKQLRKIIIVVFDW